MRSQKTTDKIKSKQNYLNNIGELLKIERKLKQVNILDISKLTNIDKNCIYNLEKGITMNPTLFTIEKICSCLNISLERLFRLYRSNLDHEKLIMDDLIERSIEKSEEDTKL